MAYAAWAARERRGWLPAAGTALALGLAGCVVQVFEYANLHFSPTDGGYASVFIGWTILFVVFVLSPCTGSRSSSPRGCAIEARRRQIVPAGLADAAFYWGLLAGIGVLTWAILYLF